MALEFDLAETRRLVLDGLAGLPAQVYLFGSQASGQIHRGSDIDVGIDAGEPLNPLLLARIADSIEESDVLRFVDLVDMRTIPAEFADRIRREGLLWSA